MHFATNPAYPHPRPLTRTKWVGRGKVKPLDRKTTDFHTFKVTLFYSICSLYLTFVNVESAAGHDMLVISFVSNDFNWSKSRKIAKTILIVADTYELIEELKSEDETA